MKRLVLMVLTFVFTCLVVTPVTAKGLKVPKQLCLDLLGSDLYVNIATKPGGTMKLTDNQKIKFYTLQGFLLGGRITTPITGSAFMDVSTLRVHFTGTYVGSGVFSAITGDILWYPEIDEGELLYIESEAGEIPAETVFVVRSVPCGSVGD